MSAFLGRQPVIQMLEGALDKVKSTWEHYDDQMKLHMDEIVSLQRQCLEIEQQHLDMESRAAGIVTNSKSTKKGNYGCPAMY